MQNQSKKAWQERQAIAEKNRKLLTCPVCGKRCREFLSPRGIAMPLHGFLGHGQWYCSTDHWMQDPNSSYHKRARSQRKAPTEIGQVLSDIFERRRE